jgi:3',5'-cyclic AMP phosphodiesterase CpdA
VVDAVTLLHVSDPQFGKNHIFGGNGGTPADQAYDTLVVRLIDDLGRMRESYGLRPDLMIVTGDLTEWARPAEFAEVRRFLVEVSEFLGLARDRVVIVPGNHDISRAGCSGYFSTCEADGIDPVKPYWPKWRQYLTLFEDFYRDVPGVTFQVDQEWSLFKMPDLRVVVAGLNSTMAESHLETDHYGEVGEAQCRWFADALQRYEEEGWLRIGAVHHNAVRGAVEDNENLRDADVLTAVVPRLRPAGGVDRQRGGGRARAAHRGAEPVPDPPAGA